jgi:hypothetical protein
VDDEIRAQRGERRREVGRLMIDDDRLACRAEARGESGRALAIAAGDGELDG